MGLEDRCGDEDMHVSTARIPTIHEHPLDISEGDSVEDSRILQAMPESQLPRTIYAPLGDAEFWIGIHLGLVSYAMREAEKQMLDVTLASTRLSLVQNDLYRQFSEKMNLQEELNVQKSLAKHYKFAIQIAILLAQNKVEEKDNLLKMYEERFGTISDLLKLAQAEENSKLPGPLGPRKYVNIAALIKQHETGDRYTLGDKIFAFTDRLLSPKTYSDIAAAVYNAFTGKSRESDSCG